VLDSYLAYLTLRSYAGLYSTLHAKTGSKVVEAYITQDRHMNYYKSSGIAEMAA